MDPRNCGTPAPCNCTPFFRNSMERSILDRSMRVIARSRLGQGDARLAEGIHRLEAMRIGRAAKTRIDAFPGKFLEKDARKDLQSKYELYFSKAGFLASEAATDAMLTSVLAQFGDPSFPDRDAPLPSSIPGAAAYNFQELLFRVQGLMLTFPPWLSDDIQLGGSWIYVKDGTTAENLPAPQSIAHYGPREFAFDGQADVIRPALQLASTAIERGKSRYTSLHLLFEDDVLDQSTAESVGFGILVVVELALLAGKLLLAMEIDSLANPFPGRLSNAQWSRIKDAAMKAVNASGDDSRSLLLQLFVDLFGPDFFESVAAIIDFNWNFPNRPTWGGEVRVGIGGDQRVMGTIINSGPGAAFVDNIETREVDKLDTRESDRRRGVYRLDLGFRLDEA